MSAAAPWTNMLLDQHAVRWHTGHLEILPAHGEDIMPRLSRILSKVFGRAPAGQDRQSSNPVLRELAQESKRRDQLQELALSHLHEIALLIRDNPAQPIDTYCHSLAERYSQDELYDLSIATGASLAMNISDANPACDEEKIDRFLSYVSCEIGDADGLANAQELPHISWQEFKAITDDAISETLLEDEYKNLSLEISDDHKIHICLDALLDLFE